MSRYIILILEDKGASDPDLAFNTFQEFKEQYEAPPMMEIKAGCFVEEYPNLQIGTVSIKDMLEHPEKFSSGKADPETILPSQY